jgi:hypothetical protein
LYQRLAVLGLISCSLHQVDISPRRPPTGRTDGSNTCAVSPAWAFARVQVPRASAPHSRFSTRGGAGRHALEGRREENGEEVAASSHRRRIGRRRWPRSRRDVPLYTECLRFAKTIMHLRRNSRLLSAQQPMSSGYKNFRKNFPGRDFSPRRRGGVASRAGDATFSSMNRVVPAPVGRGARERPAGGPGWVAARPEARRRPSVARPARRDGLASGAIVAALFGAGPGRYRKGAGSDGSCAHGALRTSARRIDA